MNDWRFLSHFCVLLVAIFSMTALVPEVSTAAPSARTTKSSVSTKKSKRYASRRSRRGRRSRCTVAARMEGKRKAMELVSTTSTDLCKRIGLTPNVTDSARALTQELINADGEEEVTTAVTGFSEEDQGEDLAELEAEDDVTVDVEQFRTLWLSYMDDNASKEITEAGIDKQAIVDQIMDWLGTRYDFGGQSRQGIDCSAFTRMIYSSTANAELPRTAAEQYHVGSVVKDRRQMEFGDLVFFHTRKRVRVSHVGIYLGDNLFAHASSRYGVTISSLESTYYSKRLIGARRITGDDIANLAPTHAALR
jgi:cell wall-associated NlpC family hydrolase